MTTDPSSKRCVVRPPTPLADLAAALARADGGGLVDVAYATTDSPIGPLLVAATPAGLVRLAFQREDEDEVLEQLAHRVSPRVLEAPDRLDEVRRELDEYFDGQPRPLRAARSTGGSRAGFRKTVLERLYADVDYGRTVSYLELATMVGQPEGQPRRRHRHGHQPHPDRRPVPPRAPHRRPRSAATAAASRSRSSSSSSSRGGQTLF